MSQISNKNELTILSNWWFNIDKQLLICFLILTFFGLSGEAYLCRVCYQRGLPRLVY